MGLGNKVLVTIAAMGFCLSSTVPVLAAGEAPAWRAVWEKTVAAAKKEGKIVVSGAPGETWRKAVMMFEEDYPEIKVDYTGLNSRDFYPRMRRERTLGQYLWDIRIGGADSLAFDAKNERLLDPVRPLLILPEVVDGKAWLGGLTFLDNEGQYINAFLAYETQIAVVNRDFVPESELRSVEQLLDPRWKGKIVLQDPRGGAALMVLTGLVRIYGEPFVRDLLQKQDIVVTGDNRQQIEWVVRGRYPIGIGVAHTSLEEFKKEGLAKNVVRLTGKAALVTNGFGGFQLVNQRPHPNATTVFINWILTAKTQARLAKTVFLNSRRLDVPINVPELAVDRNRLGDYLNLNLEKYRTDWDVALGVAKEILK